MTVKHRRSRSRKFGNRSRHFEIPQRVAGRDELGHLDRILGDVMQERPVTRQRFGYVPVERCELQGKHVLQDEVPRTEEIQLRHPVDGALRNVHDGRPFCLVTSKKRSETNIICSDPNRINGRLRIQVIGELLIVGIVVGDMILDESGYFIFSNGGEIGIWINGWTRSRARSEEVGACSTGDGVIPGLHIAINLGVANPTCSAIRSEDRRRIDLLIVLGREGVVAEERSNAGLVRITVSKRDESLDTSP